MWAENAVFYQIYPLGLLDAPRRNEANPEDDQDKNIEPVNRIKNLTPWLGHIKKLGADALYLCPVFESDSHGYDTRDFLKIDNRLGSNQDFKEFCRACHENNMKIVLDGVFHHVGRNFWAFRDVRKNQRDSRYKDWFHVNFYGDSAYHDSFYYEGWEGHYELVKLNLRNPEVKNYILDCIKFWVDEFDIDGLRLDVAYSLEPDFLRELRRFANNIKPEFYLIGETLHGDYNRWVSDEFLHSCTNYECYKGLYSSFNSRNMFEIIHSLKRQFGPEYWTLYKNKHLLCFVDNHDVTRVASILKNAKHLNLIYGLLFAMPGIPCIYYGSEWGCKGKKQNGDDALRPAFENPEWNDLTDIISKMAKAHKNSRALCHGDFQDLCLTNLQTVFRRRVDGETVLAAVNCDENAYFARFDAGCGQAVDLLSGKKINFTGGCELPPYSVMYLRCQ